MNINYDVNFDANPIYFIFKICMCKLQKITWFKNIKNAVENYKIVHVVIL